MESASFRGFLDVEGFETYFDIKYIFFTFLILGFYKHLDNLKKKSCLLL